MTQVEENTQTYLWNFDRLEREDVRERGSGNGAAGWVEALRRAGIERFREVGFPTTRQEEWRHTNVAPIARVPFAPAEFDPGIGEEQVRSFSFRDESACELVFVNGFFAGELSATTALPRGVHVMSLAAALSRGDPRLRSYLGREARIEANPFVALNTGFVRDGAVVYLEKGAAFELPIHLLFVGAGRQDGTAAVAHPRVLVVAEDDVDAAIVESYVGVEDGGVYFTNAVSEYVVGENSRVDVCRVQQESLEAYHVSTTQARVGRSSTFINQSATLGGQLTRNDLNVVLAGEGADATLNGLVIIGGRQHVDNHTLLDHAACNCPSHELYKHVLSGSASGVFRGKILVRPGSQKTDSKQTSRSLLLSDDAVMNSQPALEIYADDVKCTHGSTTGPVDEDMVFYLRTRGVSLEAARHLLTYAFAADITRRIRVEPVRRRLENFMAAQHGLPQDLRITDLGRYDEEHR